MKDLGAGLRNFFGGRSAGYEEELQKARGEALAELEQRAGAMGANAVIGVDIYSCDHFSECDSFIFTDCSSLYRWRCCYDHGKILPFLLFFLRHKNALLQNYTRKPSRCIE